MGCCGQKGNGAGKKPRPLTQGTHHTGPPAGTGFQIRGDVTHDYYPVILRYLESSPIVVRGPVTGRRYEFSGRRCVQSVDERDAAVLLQMPFFSPVA